MNDEPTREEQQGLAFQLLKRKAIEAHLEGDGLRINLLCATAIEGIESLLKVGQLKLSLKDLSWIFIFQNYWLLDHISGHFGQETFGKIPVSGERDEKLAAFLRCHWYLISEALSGLQPAFDKLRQLDITVFSDQSEEYPIELVELILHLGELAWFRSPAGDEWKSLLMEWERLGPKWVREHCSRLRQRLTWQTRFVVPHSKAPVIEESELAKLRAETEFGELWLLHLHGRSAELIERVKEKAREIKPDSYEWRIVLDFWHINRLHVPGDKEEGQMRWLARRQQLSAETPLLRFQDRRELRINEKIAEVFRENMEANAADRWEALRLAQLHELAAMRMWDFGMWRDATRAQSEAWLEAGLWMKNQPVYAVHGLLLGVRSMSLPEPKKDLPTRTAIEHLEFAPPEVLKDLVDQLLSNYPLQKYNASKLIDEIADLFPPESWQRLAEWTTTVSRQMDEKRTAGQSLGFAAFWWKLFPDLTADSPIWHTLLQDALAIASIRFCWKDEGEAFLYFWLKHAPIDMAVQVAEALVKQDPVENIFSLYKAELLIDAEKKRPEFQRRFTSQLPLPGRSIEERIILSGHLNLESKQAEVESGVASFTDKLFKRIEAIAPLNGTEPANVPRERINLECVPVWDESHLPLLDRLLAAVQNQIVRLKDIPELLNMVQWLLVRGPRSFFVRVRPVLEAWIVKPPSGLPQNLANRGPFVSVHITELDAEDVQEQLSWIVYQYVRQEGLGAADLVDALAEKSVQENWTQPMGIIFRSLIVLSSKLPIERANREINFARLALEQLRVQTLVRGFSSMRLANTLSFVSSLVDAPQNDLIDWTTETGQATLPEFLKLLEVMLPLFAQSVDVRIRVKVAKVVASVEKWRELPSKLKDLSANLATDNRARVRHEIKATDLLPPR